MVDALHAAGLEVLLDVVFNHTAEGDQSARRSASGASTTPPTTGWTPATRALRRHDRLRQLAQRRRPAHPAADHGLAAVLADRDARRRLPLRPGAHPGPPGGRVRQVSAFLDLVSQDPVVSRAKLIAEPWDVGQMDSYDLGRFPPVWREWNGKYRDTMRDFWRSHPVGLGEFATRFAARPTCTAARGAAHRLGEPDHRARRLHPARPGLLRRQAQRGQRRESTATGPTTTAPGTAARRAPPTTRPSWRCAPGSPGRCSPPCCCRSACRCCSAATRWAAPSRATTTPTARTTRSPGSTGPAPTPNCWPSPGG